MDDIEALLARRNRALGAGVSTFYRRPLHIVRGDGTYLFDAQGRRYVDMYNNVPCVGHANRRVVEAMARAQSTLNTHSRYLHEGIVEFAERLTALHGDRIESVVFSCSGTEAIEVALRMARFATGRRGIVCTDATYHGNSELVGALTDLGHRAPPPDVRAIPFPEKYRPIADGLSEADLTEAYLDRLRLAIAGLQASGDGVAALIVCSILANEGLPDIPAGFMPRAAELVRAAGGLVISDEVQAGYCRTGRWWGYEITGFEPDIVVTGKPMGNGLPLSATAASKALVDNFRGRTRHFNTFAQSPLQAAVGMAVLDEIEERGLRQCVGRIGAWLIGEMKQRIGRWPSLGDVRGVGLFIGAEMVTDRDSKTPDPARAADIAERLKDKGFLTAAAGAHNNSVKIRPPLVYAQSDAEAFLDAFDEAMDERMDRALAAGLFAAPARDALRAFGVKPSHVELVSVSENVTFRVIDGEDDAIYALRLHRPGYHTLAELDSERLWTDALTAAGVAAPSSVPARDGRYYLPVQVPAVGEERYAGMVRWTEGEILDEVIRRESGDGALPRRFEQLGTILAAMHNQASGWRAPASFTRHHLDIEGLMGEAPFWGRFWEHPRLASDERTLMQKTRERIIEALGRYGKSEGRYSVIHADLHPGNVLVADGRLSVIDFDDAGFGWHMYDAAVSLVHQQSLPHFASVREALFRGYRALRPLSPDDEAMLPMFLLIRGMAQIGWLGQRPELTGDQYVDYLAHIRAVVGAQCEAFEAPC